MASVLHKEPVVNDTSGQVRNSLAFEKAKMY